MRLDKIIFPEGKYKAVTLSFDDGVIQDERLVALMDKYNLKSTFNINSGMFGQRIKVNSGDESELVRLDKEAVKNIYKNHEIAIHTVNHFDLTSLSSSAQMYEVIQDKCALEKLGNNRITGMATPFGNMNDVSRQIMELAELIYARSAKSSRDFSIPKDFLSWNPTCHFADPIASELIDSFKNEEDSIAVAYPWTRFPQLFSVWGHSYELDDNDKWNALEAMFAELAFQDDIWYATNGEIFDYLNASKKLQYCVASNMVYNPTCQKIWINTDGETTILINPGEIVEL